MDGVTITYELGEKEKVKVELQMKVKVKEVHQCIAMDGVKKGVCGKIQKISKKNEKITENIRSLPMDGVKRENVDPSPRSSELKEGETRPRGPCTSSCRGQHLEHRHGHDGDEHTDHDDCDDYT